MANKVKLKTLVEKMNTEKSYTDVDLSEKEVEIPDINRPALQLTDSLNILIPNVCSSDRICGVHPGEDDR